MRLAKDREGLTKKQRDFCLAFIETGNASEAYRRSYSCERQSAKTIKTNAHRLLHEDAIAAKIAALRAEIDGAAVEKLALSRELVIDDLMQIVEVSMGRKLVKAIVYNKHTGKPEEVEISQFNMWPALRALELLGKVDTIGLFVERSKVDATGRFEAMSEEELDAYIAELDAKRGYVKIEDLPKLGYVKAKGKRS